ncbi:eukaryotic translation initiation factor 4B3 [Heracleum sosnowskyi]|uniref:Eukaryotic translation initiation factor 4B3 n=1 Tax=Heracleum sosnowskyi TaxID=360622 RepID=A0AAD8IZI4_9APIA|nr:eukaryotic translation initiation factor 4B3 [Heracleum sosnowskyi]
MAATVTSPWGNKPKSWALDAEEHEQELIEQHKSEDVAAAAPLADFPSLAAVANTKTKKKKPQAMNLAEFSTYDASKFRENKDVDVMNLPKGPRERSAEELEMNKGFRSWGVERSDRNDRKGGFDETRRGGFREREGKEFTVSRADETENWGAKKGTGSVGGGFERGERRERGGFFENSQSKADESDNWGANKSYVPSERKYERQKVGFETSGGADSDNWGKKKEEEGRKFGAFDSLRERRGGGFERDESWGKKREDVGGVRPKLNLQPRKVPIGDEVNGGVVKPKGSNPFGNARPREEVLKEKGQDWKEVDEKLESLKLKEKEAAGLSDGPGFGKRSFGSGNGLSGGNGDRAERSWRKPVDGDVRPQSAENARGENGHAEEAETSNSENCA